MPTSYKIQIRMPTLYDSEATPLKENVTVIFMAFSQWESKYVFHISRLGSGKHFWYASNFIIKLVLNNKTVNSIHLANWYAVRPPYKRLRVIKTLYGNMFYNMKFSSAFSKDSKLAIVHWYTLLKSLFLRRKYQVLTQCLQAYI